MTTPNGDDRIKRRNRRADRATADASRAPAHDNMAFSDERKKAFASEWQQESLPQPPELPGFHLCYLSTTNSYDPIYKRLKKGYIPVRAEEMPGFESMKIKSGEHTGYIGINEMILHKLPLEIYQEVMAVMHHDLPNAEQEKIAVQAELLTKTKDRSGKTLGQIEGDGMEFDLSRPRPIFQ